MRRFVTVNIHRPDGKVKSGRPASRGWGARTVREKAVFQDISIHLIGWVFSRRADRTMQEDLSATADSSRAGAQARHCDSGGVRLPAENLTHWNFFIREKPPKTDE